MSNDGHLVSERESFFTIDTETIGNNDTGVVLNIAMVYVNMPKLIDESGEDNIFSPKEFIEKVETIDLYPNLSDQYRLGRNRGGNAMNFWKKEFNGAKNTNNSSYLDYIKKMITDDPNKPKVLDVINDLHKFIKEGVNNTVSDGRMKDKDIPFTERGGGFDTNKFYTMRDSVLKGYEVNDSIFIPHWSRRELRTILSTNRWRDGIGSFIRGTNWTKEFTKMVVDDIGMEKHMAIFDALLDAYGVYCLKLTQPHFYL